MVLWLGALDPGPCNLRMKHLTSHSLHVLIIRQITPSSAVSGGALNLYSLGYIYGFSVSFVVYTGLSIALPPRSTFVYDDGNNLRDGNNFNVGNSYNDGINYNDDNN